MRVLHLLAPAPFGGLESVVESLTREQIRAGHDVHVVAITGVAETRPALLDRLASGVTRHHVAVPARAYLRERSIVRHLLARLAPDVVHTHGYRPDVLHGRSARRMGAAVVTTVHGFTGGDLKNRFYEKLQLRAFRRYDAVVAVSEAMRARLLGAGVPAQHIHCVPNAYADTVEFLTRDDARAELGIPRDGFCIGWVGRLGREKGPDIFVDAIAGLRGGARAVVIGDGAMRGELERRAAQLAVDVRWAGAVENAARLLRAFDLVVLSSRTEGTPIVLLEAMAAGVPVVATRVGGVPAVVTDREAVLAAPDDVSALEEAMRAAMVDVDASRARAARALERLRVGFGTDAWQDAYEVVYRGCIREQDHQTGSVRVMDNAVEVRA